MIEWIIMMFDKFKYIRESKDKVICVYRMIDDKHKVAEGEMYFQGKIFNFISGKYGKGYAPKGNYKAYKLLKESREAFKQFDFGWQVPLESQFKSDRVGLAVHPDGNKVGTLGCIGCNFASLDENVLCHNLFRDYFEKSNILNVEVV